MTSSSFLSVPQSGRCPWMAASNLLPHRMVRLIRPGSCKSFFFLRWDIQDSDACPLWLYQGTVMPLETATQPRSAHSRPLMLQVTLPCTHQFPFIPAPTHAALLPVLLPSIPLPMLQLSHHHMPWCPSTLPISAWSLYAADLICV